MNKTTVKNSSKREKAFLGLLVILSISTLSMTSRNMVLREPAGDVRAYVLNYKDFRLHTEVHIQNVRRLGMELYELYKDTEFKDVSRGVLVEKLRMHDYEKLASQKELIALGYEHNRPLGERIYDYYGEDKEKLSATEKEKFQELVDELNSYAGQYELAFYKKYGLLDENNEVSEVGRKIASIEKVADLVERANNPISLEEFNREKMRSAEDYLTDPKEKTLAKALQEHYDKGIPMNYLEPRTAVSLRGLRCEGMFM